MLLKIFSKKIILKKVSRRQQKHERLYEDAQSKKTFCGFSMGRNQYWAGRVLDLCVYYMTGAPEGSTESGFAQSTRVRSLLCVCCCCVLLCFADIEVSFQLLLVWPGWKISKILTCDFQTGIREIY